MIFEDRKKCDMIAVQHCFYAKHAPSLLSVLRTFDIHQCGFNNVTVVDDDATAATTDYEDDDDHG